MDRAKWTRAFWIGLAERAAWSFLIMFIVTLVGPNFADATGFDIRHAGWLDALALGAGAALVSAIKSLLVNLSGIGPTGSASAVYDRPRDVGVAPHDGS